MYSLALHMHKLTLSRPSCYHTANTTMSIVTTMSSMRTRHPDPSSIRSPFRIPSALQQIKVEINKWFERDDVKAWIKGKHLELCKKAKTVEAATEEDKAGVLCTQLAKDATDLSPAKKAIASMFTGGTAVLKLAAQPEVCKQLMAYAEPHLKSTIEKCPKSLSEKASGYLGGWVRFK